MEYVREDDTQEEMQALGPAEGEREAKLRDLNMVDDKEPVEDQVAPMDEDESMDVEPTESSGQRLDAEETSNALQGSMESALTPADIHGKQDRTLLQWFFAPQLRLAIVSQQQQDVTSLVWR